MHYYYISFFFKGQFSGGFFRGVNHPFHPEEMKKLSISLSRQASMATKEVVFPEHIAYIAATIIPEDAAKARWPSDFT